MWWFKSRPKQRKVAKREDRFTVEQLEQRLPPGNYWVPWTGIDITAIMPDAGIYVAGQIVEFSIVGSGEDWDKSVYQDGSNTPGELAQDTVWITWSGAFCVPVNGGKQAWCQLGSAGSPGIFRISMFARDEAATQAGDSGTRDDDDVAFTADVAAIWVDIALKTDGPLDDDHQLRFWGDSEERKAGSTEAQGLFERGFWRKVELTGTVYPQILNTKDGLGDFEWKQSAELRNCSKDWNGNWYGGGQSRPDDDPLDENRTTTTVNWKVFSLDQPGTPKGPNMDNLAADFQLQVKYQNLTTYVTYKGPDGLRASNDFLWNVVGIYYSNGVSWLSEPSSIVAGTGHHPDFPPRSGDPNNLGLYPVDCSNQPY